MHESSQEQNKTNSSITQGLAPVNGAHLSYEIAGQGHPLVFVQGSTSIGMHTWDDQFLLFSAFYQVLRYDTRGVGKSSDPGQPYSKVDDLFGLLQYLGIKKAYFVEFGGKTVLKLLQKHGNLADALVLVSVAFLLRGTKEEILDAMAPKLLEMISPVSQALEQNDVSKAVDILMNPLGLPLPTELPRYYQKVHTFWTENSHLLSHSPTAPQEASDSGAFPQEQFEQLTVPTLVLRGEHDNQGICESFTRLIQTIPNVQHHIIAESSFMPSIDNPEEFNQTVLQFLQSLGEEN